jgi:putative membrane-bound dehydrogenase-like protein
MLRTAFSLLSLCLVGLLPGMRLHAAELQAGVAVVDITPPAGYRMAGYFRERFNTGTHDPLQAKALVLRQGEEQAALVFCDLVGISRDVSDRARKLAAKKTGIPSANILIAATHSHTGPLYMGALRKYFHEQVVAAKGSDPHEKIDYPAALVEKIADAIAKAHKSAKAVALSAGVERQEGLSFNRRFHMKDGTVQFNPGKRNPNIVRPVGPIDPDVGLLRLRAGDKDLALMSVFALHLDTVGGTEYSADYPFYLERRLRPVLGAEGVSLFGAGTCGDINHIDVSKAEPQSGHVETGRIGTTLGDTIRAALPKLRPQNSPRLAVRRTIVHAPLQKYSAEAIAQARNDMAKIGARDLPFLKQVEAYKISSLQMLPGDTLPMEVQVFRLSKDVAIVGLPGEIFVELGLAIKKASPFPITLVVELCNDAPGYVPTRKAFKEGSYETVNSRIQAGGGEKLVEAATRLLKELADANRASPESSSFHLAAGLRMELVAAEPEIESPVAMEFDEEGRLWVVEMRDYPHGPRAGSGPQGRIRVLEDRDGDGRYERSTIFAEGLLFANGVFPWRDGAIVTAAPQILWPRDTDGDGRADRTEVLFEGFTAGNPQLRASHPVLGLDGNVYVANGLRGGEVRRAGKEGQIINLNGRDFRFDPRQPDRFEAISGMGQYGNCFDDWGRRFVCDNRHHLRHVVLENRYLARNPYLAVPAVLEDISTLELGAAGAGAKVYPLSRNWTTSNLHAGHFTSACSVFVYRGDLLPSEFRGSAFTCEPAGNLVHREVLRPHGATFQSHPVPKDAEFFASSDDWTRPVFLADGPDGALYLVDMHRAVIEHPEFMPPELKQRPNLSAGKEQGRIWRIVPEGHHAPPPRPRLSKATNAELVRLLEHGNAWWRTTAQRLLLQRSDPKAVEPLRRLVESSRRPAARVTAAWLLESLHGLDTALLLRLLADDHPNVRENALRLTEIHRVDMGELPDAVVRLADDADARVRFQAALTLGEWNSDRILAPLAAVAVRDAVDPWTRRAIASSIAGRAGALLSTLLRPPYLLAEQVKPERLVLVQELTALVGARQNPDEVMQVLEGLFGMKGDAVFHWQAAGLNGLAGGMGRRGTRLSDYLASLASEPSTKPRAIPLQTQVDRLLARMADRAGDEKLDLRERLQAVSLLAHAPWNKSEPVLRRLLEKRVDQDLRLAAVRAVAAHPQKEAAALLLDAWAGATPAVRREVLEALFQRGEWLVLLLEQIESGKIQASELDPARIRQLLDNRRADIRQRARKALAKELPEERQRVLQRYRSVLTQQKGNVQRGREVFHKNCATCHRIADVGILVGPDISDTRTKTAEQLLNDILNPNAAIDSNYINYLVTTRNGKVYSGIIAAETASSVTLRRAENQTDTVLRRDIEDIRSTGQSLMPEGLEKTISLTEMADLLSFLKNWRYQETEETRK